MSASAVRLRRSASVVRVRPDACLSLYEQAVPSGRQPGHSTPTSPLTGCRRASPDPTRSAGEVGCSLYSDQCDLNATFYRRVAHVVR